MEVHSILGPGLLESAYEVCLVYELRTMGISFERQVPLPVKYKGLELDCAYKMDLVVAQEVVLELKVVETLLPIHDAQILTYLKLSEINVGLLLNFNVARLKDGLKRFAI